MCLQQKKMEKFTGEFLKQEGYVTKVLLSDGNLGVDMFAEKNGKLCALQVKLCDNCKNPISPEMLMELFGAMHYYGCQKAMFVYNGYINDEVSNVARKLGIQLIYFDSLQYVNSSSEDTMDSSLSGSAMNYANELKLNITLNGYKRYYGSLEFQRDLMRYFNVSRGYSGRPYPWIGYVSPRSNPPRREGCPSSSRENNFYFSFCLFFHNLQAQSIFILSGRDMMDRFHAETGVPMISCGLGGIMHPAHVLLEAGLLPHGAEVPAYIKMIDAILPAIRSQVSELKAYADVDKLYIYIEDEIVRFRQRLANGKPHPTYLIEAI